MELKLTNFPPYAIHLNSSGFTLIKKNEENYICEKHQSAPLAALERECGIFFGAAAETETVDILSNFVAPVLIPQEIYQKPAGRYVALQYNLTDNETIFEDVIADYVALYPFPISKIAPIQKAVKMAVFHHTDVFLYRESLSLDTPCPHKLLILPDHSSADFVFIQNGRLKLVNQFRFTSSCDILYHVLNLLLQHQIDTRDCMVGFIGKMAGGDGEAALFRKHLPRLQFIFQ